MENDHERRSSSSEEEVFDVVLGQEETGSSQETIQETINRLIAQAEQERNKRKQAVARAEQEKALKAGTFYSLISNIWFYQVVHFSEIDFEPLRRTIVPPFYMSVITAAQEVEHNLEPYDDHESSRSSCSSKSKSSHNYSTALKPRPAICFFRKQTQNMPGFEAAHLIPHSNTCAVTYIPLAETVCGVHFFTDNILERQRILMWGSKKKICTPQVVSGATNNETFNPGNE